MPLVYEISAITIMYKYYLSGLEIVALACELSWLAIFTSAADDQDFGPVVDSQDPTNLRRKSRCRVD